MMTNTTHIPAAQDPKISTITIGQRLIRAFTGSDLPAEPGLTSAGEVEFRQNSDAAKVPPSLASSAVPSHTVKDSGVAQSSDSSIETPSPASSPVERFFIATFAIREANTGKIRAEVVEVPHTENPRHDQNEAWKIIRARFPQIARDDIRRTAGRIIVRPGGKSPVIQFEKGQTIRQIFPDKTEFEAARTVGTVVFEGALCDIILRHIRSKSAFSVTLRQPGGTVVNFSQQITTTRLADELPKIVADQLGAASETMRLYFKLP